MEKEKNPVQSGRISLQHLQPTIVNLKEELLVTLVPRWMRLPSHRGRPVFEERSPPDESWLDTLNQLLDHLDDFEEEEDHLLVA